MIRLFKATALLEGTSLLLLLFFAMPMKYLFHNPIFVKTIGMGHGILFILYIVLATILLFKEKWTFKKYGIIMIASVIPVGTFYVDRKYLQHDA